MNDSPAFRAWVRDAVRIVDAASDPAFRVFLGTCLESPRAVNLNAHDLQSAGAFVVQAMNTCEKLGLTRSYAKLEPRLYTLRA